MTKTISFDYKDDTVYCKVEYEIEKDIFYDETTRCKYLLGYELSEIKVLSHEEESNNKNVFTDKELEDYINNEVNDEKSTIYKQIWED